VIVYGRGTWAKGLWGEMDNNNNNNNNNNYYYYNVSRN
jgi:hypothetical protein